MTYPLAVLVPVLPTHERWFVESQQAGDWSFFFSPLPLVLTTAVVVVTVLWRVLALRVDRPELAFLAPLGRLVPWVPRLLGIHLGVALLALAATGAFMTPANDDLHGVGGTALLLVEAALGIWLVTGINLRPAAGFVLALGPALALVAGPTALGESANLAAVAAFLLVVPPGPDAHGAAHPSKAQLRLALLLLRLGVGTALIVLAFSEKLTNPAMAIDTLERFPALDVFSLVGIQVSPETFVAIAGATELLFGLLVISGAFPQVAVLVAMVPFNATLLLFGQTEMVGHLPVYGVFLALLAYGSSAQTAAAVRWLPSPAWRRLSAVRHPVEA
ncbi:hypothetical protein [Nocardioides zhouii]|uniref:DoxX family membrane protein n=1 Tax=Nocardioides zhouii TaxID=1168729 RepID=A0A4Q2SYU3_9ACTN|nr:hypothetical protein [Nocardioides zhouii]RYC11466.1 hypothetical protein EUA94_08835 [Nocardioides zhouii]